MRKRLLSKVLTREQVFTARAFGSAEASALAHRMARRD
jgi:hypothetical protein